MAPSGRPLKTIKETVKEAGDIKIHQQNCNNFLSSLDTVHPRKNINFNKYIKIKARKNNDLQSFYHPLKVAVQSILEKQGLAVQPLNVLCEKEKK